MAELEPKELERVLNLGPHLYGYPVDLFVELIKLTALRGLTHYAQEGIVILRADFSRPIAFVGQISAHCGKQLLRELVHFQKVLKFKPDALIRNAVIAKFNLCKPVDVLVVKKALICNWIA